jgi:fibronectin-binding autotransporter adhesin
MNEILGNSAAGTQLRLGFGSRSEASDGRSRLQRGGRMTKWKGEAASYAPSVAHLVSTVVRKWIARLLPTALLIGLGAGGASGADRYWDANGTAPNRGGAGIWDTSSSFWSPNGDGVSGPYTVWSNAAIDDAIFGGPNGTTATVTLNAPITAHNLTFDVSTTYTLTGSTLTLAGATPTVTTNGTATINSILAGNAGLTKAGAGVLSLTGANTFSGGVNVTTGTLSVSGDSSLGAAGNAINLSSGATFRSTGALAAGRVLTLLSGSSAIGGGVGSAHITGTGGFSLAAATTLSDDTNDFTGAVGTDSNTLYFTSIRNLGEASALGAPTTAANGAVFVRNTSAIYTGSGDTSNRSWSMAPFNVSGSSALRNQGTGTLTVTGDIGAGGGYSASVILDAQTADLALLGVISSNLATRPFVFTGGGATRSIALNNANTFGGAATIQNVTVRANSLADQGIASSLGTGAGVGTISLSNGVLSYIGTGSSSNRGLSINGGSSVLNDGSGSLSLSGAVTFNPAAPADGFILGGSFAGSNTLSGVISGAGNLVMNGSAGNTWLVSGANSFTGVTTVTGGTLQAGSSQAFGTSNAMVVNGGTLDLNTRAIEVASLAGTGGNVALTGADLTVNGSASTSYAGSISGVGGLVKRGTSTLTLTGQSTYTGSTTINGGTLALNFSTSAGGPTSNLIAASSALSMGGGILALTGAAGEADVQSFNGLNVTAGNNKITATSGAGGSMIVNFGAINRTGGLVDFGLPSTGAFTTINADGALGGWATVNGTDYAQVVGGNITAFTAYVNKDDAATWVNGDIVSDQGGAANTPYSGTVTGSVALGGLKYTAANNSTVTVGAGNTLSVDGAIIAAASVGNASQTIQGGSITGGAGGGTLGVIQNSTGTGTFTIASTIVDNGGATGFAKAGAGRAALSALNTYSGATTISAGTLSVNTIANGGQASAIGASGSASSNLVIEGATLQYTGATATSDRGFTLATSGAVTAGTIDVSSAGTNLTFSGQVTSPDDAGLTKIGAGTLTLSNATSNYSGATTISAGTLSVGTLANGGAASSIGASSSASINLVLQNGGTLQYTGATVASDRGFTLGTGGGVIGVSNAASTLTLSGTAIGTGSLTKTGAGTLLLSGTNSYSGGTTISAGTLRAGSAQAFGTGLMTLANTAGATLDLNGFNASMSALQGGGPNGGNVVLGTATLTLSGGTGTYAGVISGTGGVTRSGAGIQTMSGCGNTYSGATTINGSTISTDCLANGLQASGIGASSSASSNLVLTNGTLTYTGTDVTVNRGFTLAGGDGGITVSSGTTTLGFTGQVTGAGRLRKFGPGSLLLSGTNNYSGGTVVDVGTLRAGSTSAFGAGGMAFNSVDATLDLAGNNNSVLNLQSLVAGAGHVLLGSATLSITNGSNLNYSGTIDGAGSVIKSGGPGAAQLLAGCNSSYTGSTTVTSGWLQVVCLANGGTNSSIGASTSGAGNLVLNGGTLQYVGAAGSTDRQFTLGSNGGGLDASGSGAINFTSTAPVALSGSGSRTLTLTGSNTGNNTLSARLDDPAGGTTALTKTGTGTWVLTNASSTYTGVTTISGGVLAVDKLANGGQASSVGASSLLASNLVIGSGSTLRYTGAGDSTNRLFTLSTGTSFIESSGTGAIVFSNTGSAAYTGSGNRTLALGGTNTGLNTMGGTIVDGPGGPTTLAKNDSGTWALTGNNTFTGNTVVNDGNLMIGNGGTSGNAGAGNVIVANATSTLSFNRGDIFNFTGTLSGTGNIAQIGTGTTVLTSAGNTIGGATSVNAGTLQVNGGLTSTGGITVNAGTLQSNGGSAAITAPTIAMNAGSKLIVGGGTVQAAGGTQTLFTGGTGGATINISGGTLLGNGTLGGGGNVVNLTAGSLNTGAAALNLGSGNDIFLLSGLATIAGAGVDGGAGTDALQVNTSFNRTLDGAQIAGFESLSKQGAATLTLTGNHSYSAGTTISAGTLQIGNGATAGSLTTPTVANNGTLAFNLNSNYSFDGVISGTGAVNKLGSGVTTLTGNNSFGGTTNVTGGTLLINGDQSGATGVTGASGGGTLGGTGTIGGSVTISAGGRLSPGNAGNAPGTLTIGGTLALSSLSQLDFNFGQANVPGGPFNDLVNVGGDLRLDGTLNVTQTPGGTLGPGVYRIFNYGGSLTDNGLAVTDSNYVVQTSVANQVNLVNSAGLTLSYWDGDAGPHSNSAVNGGDGTWRAAGDQNWTDSAGLFAAPFANASFAIFQGAAGTVSVDNTGGQVQATGMQFATNGYVVQGNPIVLVDDPTQAGLQSIIRVGDGTAVGAAYIATIASNLTGASQLVKTDLGTLVLSGTNSYSGGTAVNGGTLQVSADANLGDAAGGLSLDTGTLHATASFASARGVSIGAGGGTLDTDNLTTLTLTGTVGGVGALTKRGAGTLVLSGPNSYQGGTVINGGTVQITADANLGAAAGTLAFDGGALNTTGSFTSARTTTLNAGGGTFDTDSLTALTLTGAIGGQGALTKTGAGALILGADNSYAGGTTISSGVLRLGTGGTTGSILGDVVDNGTLSFNRSDLYTFDGTISGSGGVSQDGTGNTVLTADNTYTGTTLVAGGGLYINGDQSAATGLTNVNNGTLGGNGIIGGDVFVDIAGRLAPGTLGTTPGTLTINGNLELAGGSNLDYSFGQAGVVGGAYNDLTVVRGDLSLDGTINVTQAAAGSFGPGIYRVISYDGGLTDNGLDTTSSDHIVQTSIAHQVNLVNTAGLVLSYWDGPSPADQNDHAIAGGSGTWRLGGNASWTEADGALNGTFDNGSFAVFAGASGTVGVDNSFGDVHVAGMQFATGGYTIEGGDIALDGPQSIIRVGDGTLPGAGYTATIVSNLTGASQLVKTDLGTLVLSGTNSYSGGTAINGGTLQVAADANLGDAAGAMSFDNGATLQNTATFSSARNVTLNTGGGTFQSDAALTLSGAIGGVGGFSKTGGAALTLTGTNAYAGPTTVTAGALYVDGDNSAATGPTSVGLGATLGGKGAIGGNVVVADGATLSPGSADGTPGTLAIAGDLSLSGGSILNYSFGQANVAGGALNDLTTVGGNLVLDGTLNVSVSAGGTFGPGVYRVFNYNGTLTDNGLSIGTIPSTDYSVQTSIANQVNLVNSDGLTLSYWDGDAGPHSNGVVNGGNGTWRAAGDQNWTDTTGIFAAPFANASFAIFAGAAGTVSVDNTNGQVQAAGMQFATGGYLVQGNDIALVGPTSTIRVGDGTGAGAAYVATINSNLTGNTQLVKTDLGTLVLAGTNSYTGGTAVNGGTLQVASDSNLGAAAGALSFDGGTLRNTASFSSARGVTLNAGGGTFETNADLTLSGMIGGAGALTKTGTSALTLTGANSYSGGTTISAGTLQLGNGGTAGSLIGNVLDNAALVFNRSNSLTYAGVVSGTGVVNQVGTGTTIFTGANTYTGGTTVSAGTLQLGNGGASGSLTGDVLDNATLAFNRSDTYTFAGLISGTGALEQIGSGVTILTANNSYTGATNVSEGTLIVDGNQSAATGTTAVEAGGVLGGIGVVGGNVAVLGGGALNPGNVGLPPGTLTINGDLTLGAAAALNYNFGQANVVGGAFNDLTVVHGDLVLDGQLNVAQTPGGNFGPGIYRVISYDGTLTDLGLSDNSPDYTVQTSIAQQVNLVNTAGLTLNYWDGAAGPKNNGAVNGGDGLWQASAGNDNWTDSTGSVNAPFTDSAFAIFAGAAGTVSVDSSLGGVSASGMQFATGGYLIQGNDIALVGPQSIIRVGDGTAASAAYIATISSSLTGKTQLVKTDLGTLVLAGTNSYTGGTAINSGTLQVASDSNLGAAAGVLSFDGGTLRTTASFNSARAMNLLGQGTVLTDAGTTLTWGGTLAGAGALTKSGAGTLALTANSSGFTGTTAIGGGTLNVSGSLCGRVNVLSGGRLEGTGTVCDTTNAAGGNIAAGNPGAPGTLTVAGNYTGNGGALEIETVLGGDASVTDRLVVTGNTSGTTDLKVTNLGSGGAQTVEGIKVVDVGGASNGTFSLLGDYVFQGQQAVVGGAYAYRLYKNGVNTPADGDWYLRSALVNPTGPQGPLYSPTVPIYEAYPAVLQSLNELGTLQQRVGNRSWTSAAQGADEIGSVPTQNAIWARIETAHSKQSPESATTVSDYDVTTWKLQSGFDGLLYEDATGILLGGLTFHYGTASSDISSIYGVGSIQATGYGFGGTLTWYGDNGFYTDGQAEVTWYDSNLKSATLGTDLGKGNDGLGYALSIEAGQKLALQGKWTLTPQAQLSYSAVRFDGFTDPFDAAVSLSRSEALIGRAGLSLDYEDAWTGAQGKVSRSHLYGIANLYYDFLDGNDVDVSGVSFHEHDQPLWGGLGLGGSLSWADDRYTVFGEAFAKSSLKDFADSNSIGAKLGFSVKW